MPDWITYWYLVIPAIVLGFYLLVPLAIKATLKLNAKSLPVALPVERMPTSVYEYFGRAGQAMSQCGFDIIAYFRMPNLTANVEGFVALWINRKRGQGATTVVIKSTLQTKFYTEFLTRLAKEPFVVLTNNATDVGAFKKTSRKDVMSAPMVEDLPRLYKLHQYREQKLGLTADKPRFLAAAGQEVEYFAHATAVDIRRQVETGYFSHAGDDVYVPTIVGAYMMTWKQLPPFKNMAAAARDRRAQQALAEADMTPSPASNWTVVDRCDDWPAPAQRQAVSSAAR